MSNRSETFGRLLKGAINSIATYEGKTAPVIEEELAEKVSLAGSAIQRYKAGYLPPEPRTIEIIAEAAVRRGFFSREWLQRFLHAARYHQADKLLDQLCPIGPARPRPPRVYQNLPAPTYSQFVERKEASAEVLEGLSKRSAAVIIVGLGGNGKTSLARETADYCLKDEEGQALFDAAVWVSDKDRPGTTNLSTVLDEIARTLDYPGFTQFEHDEKRREVEQLLRRQRVLVCVDNFETVTDGALLSWLLNLPEPSKALITTREYRREYRRGGWPVELRGMSGAEAWELTKERAQVLKIERLIGERTQIEALLAATGGNPKALALTLGLLKYERRLLQDLVDDLYAARGDLFEDLFHRAWALLDEAARRLVLAASFFPTNASGEALQATTDVQSFAFDRAAERLADLSLLDVQQESLSSKPRYALHPLVRAFAIAKLAEQQKLAAEMRERWVEWYTALTQQVGTCWDDLSRLALLDAEQETVYDVVKWTLQQQQFDKAVKLIDGSRYYYNVRGYWDKRLLVAQMRLEATRHAHMQPYQVTRSLAYVIEALCKQGKLKEAEKYIPDFHELAQSISLEPIDQFRYYQTLAIYEVGRRNFQLAEQYLKEAEPVALDIEGQSFVINLRWRGICAYHKGELQKAEHLLQQSQSEALRVNDQRSVIGNFIWLAAINLDLGALDAAAERLEESYFLTEAFQDRRRKSELLPHYARLHILRGNTLAAQDTLVDAIDLFERLGMRRELAEAREELRRLDEMGETPVA